MNYPTDLHPKDTRPTADQREDIIYLNIIQDVLEESISSYALQKPENIYDEDHHQIVRKFEFSKGLKIHKIVIAPDGYFLWVGKLFPSSLLQTIHNALLGLDIVNEPIATGNR